ncbi:MAG TPA: ATP-binding cassette domain-containing protein [Usitatibacteraceae bacterium]|nr:ATP-binding cassette domain-containing protein [Usitatibacteraceae bacterium]
MIEARNLGKRFGTVTAVADVSFRAESGAITGLLGPNGAGKTTTVRMIGSLVSIGGGSASVDGIDVAADPMRALQHCGLLTDSRGLYTRLTARENIRYYAQLRGIDATRSERTLARFSDWLDMGAILDRRTDGFSQGERVKVAITRALIHEPENVILDEPTNGLDVMSTRALRELIRRLRAEGRAVLFSSHIMQEVAALCDRIVIIAHGRVVATGSPEEILAESGKTSLEDAFVALAGIESGNPSEPA